MSTESDLRHRYPEIDWDEPVAVRVVGYEDVFWVCRLCIALNGLRAERIASTHFAFRQREHALRHIEGTHPATPATE